MKRNNAPSAADLIFFVVAPLTAIRGTVKLTQSDGDLSAHIRMGETILSTGSLPAHSLASYTASADPMVAHAWLSEVIFVSLFRVGGLPLLSVMTGLIVAATHAGIGLFLRRRGADPRWAFLAALLSLALASTHWLTRPHMFSIVGTALTLVLLESKPRYRPIFFMLLFAIWANLHGAWLYGLTMIGAYIAGDLGEALVSPADRPAWLRTARDNAIALGAATAATLANPYGIGLHREVFSAATSSSLARNMAEFLAPNFQDNGQWPFLLAILATIALFSMTTRRIELPWLAVILLSSFFALRSFRNIALFGVSAWPLIALHTSRAWPSSARKFPFFPEFARLDPGSRVGILAVPITVLMLILGLNRGKIGDLAVIPDRFSPKAFPTEAVERARQAALAGRVFDAWGWGGYIMYAWPDARLHVDPLKFNTQTIDSYTMIENMRPGWREEMNRWQIETVIVQPHSPLAKGLSLEPSWTVWYRDSTAVVFRRAGANRAPPLG
ncbi:MAG TPA: hypothetical protein VHM24_09370 [Gemmatimonadaceae bacterium]|nr:hypothetical protein [Gemmatimonadaceae bacterium]